MRRFLAFLAVAVGVGVVLGATVFRNDIAQATGLAQSVSISNTADQAVPVRGVGRTILVADNLVVPPFGQPGNPAVTPWVDTSDCQRLILVVRATLPPAGTEFYTSLDGSTEDTWWTDDLADNTSFIQWNHADGSYTTTYSFSFHGQQPAAAPFARVTFGHGEAESRTVDKAWIYCVR